MANKFERLLLAKAEVTKGTDPVPTETTDAIRVETFDVTPVSETVEHPEIGKGSMGLRAPLVVKQSITCEITMYQQGSGTAGTAPEMTPLLEACRTVHTDGASDNTFDPSSPDASENSCTIYAYRDGLLWKMIGAVGNCVITAEMGQPVKYVFSMTSDYTAPTTVAAPIGTVVWSSTTQPVIMTDAINITYDAGAVAVGSFSFDFGNNVANHYTTTENSYTVSDRAPKITISRDSVATVAVWAALIAATEVAIVGTFGLTAGNISTITATQAVREDVTYGEREERDLYNETFLLVESDSAIDDQFDIVFT